MLLRQHSVRINATIGITYMLNNTILNGNLTVTGNITGTTLSVTNGTSLGGNLSVAGMLLRPLSVRIMQHSTTCMQTIRFLMGI
jgi:hypothetical protein